MEFPPVSAWEWFLTIGAATVAVLLLVAALEAAREDTEQERHVQERQEREAQERQVEAERYYDPDMQEWLDARRIDS